MTDDLWARCRKLQQLLDNDAAELRQGVQGDIWEQYTKLLEDEQELMQHISSIIANTNDE